MAQEDKCFEILHQFSNYKNKVKRPEVLRLLNFLCDWHAGQLNGQSILFDYFGQENWLSTTFDTAKSKEKKNEI